MTPVAAADVIGTPVATHVPTPDRRATDPLARLARRHDAVCTSAVDHFEIAATLEASGMSDRACRAYGHDDVFSLAQQLFAMVPRRGSGRATPATRRRVRRTESLLRGLVYALPGLVVVGLAADAGTAVAVVALVVGWGWANAASSVGHRTRGLAGSVAARAVLRRTLLGGVAVVVLAVTGTAWLTAAPSAAAVAVSAAVGVYLVAAGTLLVLGADWWLALALVPGSVGGLLALVGWLRSGVGAGVLPGLSVVATVGLAVAATRVEVPGEVPRAALSWVDVRLAVPHLVYGALCALAVGLGPVTLARLTGEPGGAAWQVMAPLVLSMGPMELRLEQFRAEGERLLWSTSAPAEFERRVRRAFGRAVLATATVVAVVACGAGVTLLAGRPDSAGREVAFLLCSSVLAMCFFAGLVLVAAGRAVAAATALGGALVLYLAAAVRLPPATAFAVAFAALLVALLALAARTVGSARVHL